jgi:hypothetical protein
VGDGAGLADGGFATGELAIGVILAPRGSSPPLETARRIRGGGASLLLAELFDAVLLADEEAASELESARRSLGRSSSLLLPELLEEALPEEAGPSSRLGVARCSVGRPLSLVLRGALDDPVSSGPDARCSVGRSPPPLPDELADDGEPFVMGCDKSLVASEAVECSSAVPSVTMVIFDAW